MLRSSKQIIWATSLEVGTGEEERTPESER